jgi:hypothetical protein
MGGFISVRDWFVSREMDNLTGETDKAVEIFKPFQHPTLDLGLLTR